jgi:hypothetical protein
MIFPFSRLRVQKHNHPEIIGFTIHVRDISTKSLLPNGKGTVTLSLSKNYPDGCSMPVQKDDFSLCVGDSVTLGGPDVTKD